MKGRMLPAIVTLVAALLSTIICIAKQRDVIESLVIILIVSIVFYLLGKMGGKIISLVLKEEKQQKVIDTQDEQLENE